MSDVKLWEVQEGWFKSKRFTNVIWLQPWSSSTIRQHEKQRCHPLSCAVRLPSSVHTEHPLMQLCPGVALALYRRGQTGLFWQPWLYSNEIRSWHYNRPHRRFKLSSKNGEHRGTLYNNQGEIPGHSQSRSMLVYKDPVIALFSWAPTRRSLLNVKNRSILRTLRWRWISFSGIACQFRYSAVRALAVPLSKN